MARAPRLRPPLQRGRASPRWQAGPPPGRGAAADRGDPGASTGSIACAAPTAAAPRGQSCRPRSQPAPSARDWRPRSQALPVRNRVSRRDLVELFEELFGCTLASGTLDAIVQRTGQALAVPYDGLLGHIRDASAVNVDETAWGTNTRSRRDPVLVDQATKTISPLDVRHDADPRDLRDAFRSQKLKSSMRTLLVVVLCIDPQDAIEMPRTEDEKPVQAVGANGLHPTFGEGVRIRSPDRRADHPDRGVQVLHHAALSYSWRRDKRTRQASS